MEVRFVTKELFFDSAKVLAATDKATRKALSKFGAFVRTAARSSIKTRKKISAPGSPPSGHVGLLRQHILFGYDTAARSVVIGPMPLSGVETKDALPMLEFGGHTMRVRMHTPGSARPRVRELAPAKYQARPFMGPALAQELPKLPGMWAESVT